MQSKERKRAEMFVAENNRVLGPTAELKRIPPVARYCSQSDGDSRLEQSSGVRGMRHSYRQVERVEAGDMGDGGVVLGVQNFKEDLVVKARKPYTITKQRERWTDEEHRRFLEAVKLYGRAWQKIEEHVGTKTAIQIRSHAQKFFTKLEKEALSKGLPLGQAHDIDIPPPRPKRKPSNPYPRKTCIAPILSSGESIYSPYQKKDSAKNASPEKPAGNESWETAKVISENGNSSEILAPIPDASCTSISSVNKGQRSLNFPTETLSLPKGTHRGYVGDKTSIVLEKNNLEKQTNCMGINDCKQEGKCISTHGKASADGTFDGNMAGAIGKFSENQAQTAPCCPNFFARHFESDNEKHGQPINADPTSSASIAFQAAHDNSSLFAVPSFAALMPSIHNVPGFPSCTLFQNNQDAYRSFNNISPAFSNLIVSTLQQNPTVLAAARLAASFCPCSNGDTSLPSESGIGELPETYNPSPGMVAIAAATVAAATAWWAMHGLLPFCHPFPAGFSFTPLSTVTNATKESNQTAEVKEAEDDVSLKGLDAQLSNAQMHRHSAANLSPQQSSDSDESGKSEDSNAIGVKASNGKDLASAPVIGCHDATNKARLNKKQDRSSCGSNTPSSSDETDIMLENHNKNEGKMEDMQVQLLRGESNPRRSRSSGSANDSWKEVSEEGRLAFQALFSREVLPQSFSTPEGDDTAIKSNKDDEGSNTSLIDLNSKKAWMNDRLDCFQGSCYSLPRDGSHSSKSPSLGQSGQGKLKAHRTGFKPYKRCSLEAKEMKTVAGEENGAKRIRLEDEASS